MTNRRADATLAATPPCVLSNIANGVATLTLNRPERFNLLSSEMISAIEAELDGIASDSSDGSGVKRSCGATSGGALDGCAGKARTSS